MKLKLDENIGRRGLKAVRDAGHDAMTVLDQGLRGVTDQDLFEICRREGRALITLDRDFAQVLRFPPHTTSGIVVLDLGPHPSSAALHNRLHDLCLTLETRNPAGELWIVEPGRIRVHLRNSDD